MAHRAAGQERPARILPVIIASQFAGTSLWFAGNAVLGDLQRDWGLAPDALGPITSAVQLGFIIGTLVFAFFAVADRHSGYQVGGTSPFGTRRAMPVYAQQSIVELPYLYVNGGRKGFLVGMAPGELERVLKPVLADIATAP